MQKSLKDFVYNHGNNTQGKIFNCENFSYDIEKYGPTVISDFDLICDKKSYNTILTIVYFFGFLLGATLGGYLSDNFGRKNGTITGLLTATLAGCFPYFFKSYQVYLFSRFIVGIGLNAAYVSSFTLVTEFIGPKKVTLPAMWCQGYFATGAIILAGLASIFRNWQDLQLVITLLILPICGVFWYLVPESPKYLVGKKNFKKAAKVLTKISEHNGSGVTITVEDLNFRTSLASSKNNSNATCSTDQDALSDELQSQERLKLKKKENEVESSENSSLSIELETQKTYTMLDLFKTTQMSLITLNVMFNWFTCSLMFYALSLNAASLPLSPYMNGFFVNLVELPAYAFFFLEIIFPKYKKNLGKRRPIMFWSLLISGVCCVVSTIFAEISFCEKDSENKFENPYVVGGFVLVLLGKMAVSIAFALIYLYTAEMFPTCVRSNAVGICLGWVKKNLGP